MRLLSLRRGPFLTAHPLEELSIEFGPVPKVPRSSEKPATLVAGGNAVRVFARALVCFVGTAGVVVTSLDTVCWAP